MQIHNQNTGAEKHLLRVVTVLMPALTTGALLIKTRNTNPDLDPDPR
jgi:hypothetical protein